MDSGRELLGAEMTPPGSSFPIGPKLQLQGPCRRYGNSVTQPKLHVETLIDLLLAPEENSSIGLWVMGG